MVRSEFHDALATAEKLLADELANLKATQERISRLEKAIQALRELTKQETVSVALEALKKMKSQPSAVQELGLTDVVKGILSQAYPKELTPTEIRDEIVALGFDLTDYRNPLSAIHNLIGRLVIAGEVALTSRKEGKDVVRWKPIHRRISYGAPNSLANTLQAIADAMKKKV